MRLDSGTITGFKFDPWFLNMDFNLHYKHVWIYDTLGAVLLGLLLERRWVLVTKTDNTVSKTNSLYRQSFNQLMIIKRIMSWHFVWYNA
jgi:hypothetical protein